MKNMRGDERRLTTLHFHALGNRVDWLADATTIVYADNEWNRPIMMISSKTGETRALMAPAAAQDVSPKGSPDGKSIAFCRYFDETSADLFVVAASGGEATRVTFDNRFKRELCWSPDGAGILFKERIRNQWTLKALDLKQGATREIHLPRTAKGSFDVRPDRDDRFLIVTSDGFQFTAISRLKIPASGEAPSLPVRFISSAESDNSVDVNPAISPDGLRIAFVSARSGTPEIWVSNNEGRGATQLTSFGGIVTQPAWSPDGRYLVSAAAPKGRRDLFTVEVTSGSIRWVTSEGAEDTEPQWSRDGRWITFASTRGAKQNLWRIPAAGGRVQQLTYDGAAVHRETPDGRWLYYVRHEEPGLWRVSSQGGKEEVVLDRVKSELYRAWAVGRHGIYYTYQDETTKKWIIALYDPERGTERPLATVDRALPRWSGTLSVSPDERWMVVPLIEAEGSRLVLFSGVPRPRSRNDGSFSL